MFKSIPMCISLLKGKRGLHGYTWLFQPILNNETYIAQPVPQGP